MMVNKMSGKSKKTTFSQGKKDFLKNGKTQFSFRFFSRNRFSFFIFQKKKCLKINFRKTKNKKHRIAAPYDFIGFQGVFKNVIDRKNNLNEKIKPENNFIILTKSSFDFLKNQKSKNLLFGREKVKK